MHEFSGGQLVSGRPEQPHRAPVAPPFVLFHDPEAWRAEEMSPAEHGKGGKLIKDAEHQWLPCLKQLPITPGVNGVRMGQKLPGGKMGPPDPTAALVALQRNGYTIIPDDFDGGFQVRHEVRGGLRFSLKFERLVRHGTITEIEFDRDAYRDFRAKLVRDGVIRPIRPGRIKELRRRAQSGLEAAEEDDSGLQGARLRRTRAILKAVESASV